MGLRVLLMGTGEFALPAFEAVLNSQHEVVGLVTQPDRVGQGHHHHPHPVKELAQSRDVPVFQPDRVNTPESLERLREFQADLFLVAAYGQILSADLLAIPRFGAINLHGSLLPKYRGAAPVQYAVWKGEAETGVTVFQIEPKLDAGPMLGVVKTPIGPKETSGELHDRLALLAAPLALQVLEQIETGTHVSTLQYSGEVTKAPRIKKEEGLINWSLPADPLGWHIRAMQPWPMPFTFLHLPGKKPQRMLILDLEPMPDMPSLATLPPGAIIVKENQLLVRNGAADAGSVVRVTMLQPSGKKPMSTEDYLRGAKLTDAHFGPES